MAGVALGVLKLEEISVRCLDDEIFVLIGRTFPTQLLGNPPGSDKGCCVPRPSVYGGVVVDI